ncbi:hypothetical protein HYU13_01160 [Candidatus Woesearchaeota archaeon]|nr:hypothetical protein [Candidatus Woesearchaeota archaeon]
MKSKPSARPKERYIVFEATTSGLRTRAMIGHEVQNILAAHFKSRKPELSLRVLYDKFNDSKMRGTLKVNNRFARESISALNSSGRFKTLGMSGILKVAVRKFLFNKE